MAQSNDPTLSITRQAFEELRPKLEAVSEEDFIQVAVDIPSAAVTTQGIYSGLVALRPAFVETLPKFDISLVDGLETRALAMFCTHVDYKAATDPPAALAALLEDAVAKRAILLADVNTLIAYGLLSADVTGELLGANGYKNVITDLGTLASVLRTNAARITGRTTVKPDELTAAENLATKLGKVVGERQVSPQVVAQVTRNRAAAYTLFIKAYEDVRSAVQYLRHREGDADSIMPSLFAGRGGRKKATDDTGDKPNTPNPSPTPVVNPPAPAPSGNNATWS